MIGPLELTVTEALVWGVVVHIAVDWLGQNAWMARNKARRRLPSRRHGDGLMTPPRMYQPPTRWWDRHPAAYVHASLHGAALVVVFGWVAAPLALAHLLIDTRTPLAWWSRLIRQDQPNVDPFDVPLLVRMACDQAAHVLCLAAAAVLLGALG